MDKMFDRLEATLARYNELEDLLASDEVIANLDEYRKLSKEKSNIEEIVDKYNEFKRVEHDIADLEDLKHDSDPEMAEMAKMELEDVLPKKDLLKEENYAAITELAKAYVREVNDYMKKRKI